MRASRACHSAIGLTGPVSGSPNIQTAAVCVAIGAFALAAYSDVRTRRIPNEISLGTVLIGFLQMAIARDYGAMLAGLAAATAIFGVALLFFLRGTLGGGDVKLLAGASLVVGYRDLFSFLMFMSVYGGALALWVLAHRSFGNGGRRPGMQPTRPRSANGGEHGAAGDRGVPYGVAIAGAGITVLILQHCVQR